MGVELIGEVATTDVTEAPVLATSTRLTEIQVNKPCRQDKYRWEDYDVKHQ
jgi:hypothetical protein